MKAYELQVGDIISFEDRAYGHKGIIAHISKDIPDVFFDGKMHKVKNGLRVTLTNGNCYYFKQNDDLNLYELKFHAKHCPFCKTGEKEGLVVESVYDFYIKCKNCNARGPNKHTPLEAVRSWNRRISCEK